MQAGKNKVVTIDYTLKDEQGNVIDSSKDSEPFAFIFGIGYVIPGLEAALEGHGAGEKLNVDVAPEQAYGERNEGLVQTVPRSAFDSPDAVAEGMQFQVSTDEGAQVVTIVNVEKETVTIDGNHPLAGRNLNFDVAIVDVREASAQELEHGHVHADGDH